MRGVHMHIKHVKIRIAFRAILPLSLGLSFFPSASPQFRLPSCFAPPERHT